MDDKRAFRGVWIPSDVLEIPLLKTTERFYLSLYLQENNIETVDELMREIVSERALLNIKKKLIDRGLIKIITDPITAKEKTISWSGAGKECEWCGNRNKVLEKHHFPIPRAEGGVETVMICPNCHATFHSIYGRINDGNN